MIARARNLWFLSTSPNGSFKKTREKELCFVSSMLKNNNMTSILKIMKAWQLILNLDCLIQRLFWNVGVLNQVTIVIPKEDWNVVWTYSNVIPLLIPPKTMF